MLSLFIIYLPSYIQFEIVDKTGECNTMFLEMDRGLSKSNTPRCGAKRCSFLFMF